VDGARHVSAVVAAAPHRGAARARTRRRALPGLSDLGRVASLPAGRGAARARGPHAYWADARLGFPGHSGGKNILIPTLTQISSNVFLKDKRKGSFINQRRLLQSCSSSSCTRVGASRCHTLNRIVLETCQPTSCATLLHSLIGEIENPSKKPNKLQTIGFKVNSLHPALPGKLASFLAHKCFHHEGISTMFMGSPQMVRVNHLLAVTVLFLCTLFCWLRLVVSVGLL